MSTESERRDSYRILAAESVDRESLCALYESVGWSSYTRDINLLLAAIRGSDFLVIAQENDTLVGLARAISDDASVAYIQDILVRPSHQGRGIGKDLVRAVLERYGHVRQKVLLTDNRPEQLQFYSSLGFKNTRNLVNTDLNAFVIIEGAELT
jgi:GNAT superfamily N-acetyltransferase